MLFKDDFYKGENNENFKGDNRINYNQGSG